MFGVCFFISNFRQLEHDLRWADWGKLDKENRMVCVARERSMEMEECKKAGVKIFYAAHPHEINHFGLVGSGVQNTLTPVRIYDEYRNEWSDLTSYTLLVRTACSHELNPIQEIERIGGRVFCPWEDHIRVRQWYKLVYGHYLKRNVAVLKKGDIDKGVDLSQFKDALGRFFIKCEHKTNGHAGVTDSIISHFGYDLEFMNDDVDLIISEPLIFKEDYHGKIEYRAYVWNNNVSSISRYIDYSTNYDIPMDVIQFYDKFVSDHKSILPPHYVADIGLTDRGLVLVELNPITAAGRYEKNDFCQLLKDIKRMMA